MGRPSRVNPQGMDIAGSPVKLAGRHEPTRAGRTPICFAIDLHGFGADERCGDGDRGRNDGVDALEGRVKFGEQTLSHVKTSEITNGWHIPARIDSLAHFLAVITGARRKISGGLVDMKRFRKRNVGRRFARFLQVRKGNFPHDGAALFHVTQGRLCRAAHFAVQLFPIKLARTAQTKFAEGLSLQRAVEILHWPWRGSWVP